MQTESSPLHGNAWKQIQCNSHGTFKHKMMP